MDTDEKFLALRLENDCNGKISGIKCDMENQTDIFEAFEKVKGIIN